MSKVCDTANTPVHLLMSYEDQDTWCRRCYRDMLASDDSDIPAVSKGCRKCGIVHLAGRMFEKIEGWLCRCCAKKYDEELLAKFVPAQSNERSAP